MANEINETFLCCQYLRIVLINHIDLCTYISSIAFDSFFSRQQNKNNKWPSSWPNRSTNPFHGSVCQWVCGNSNDYPTNDSIRLNCSLQNKQKTKHKNKNCTKSKQKPSRLHSVGCCMMVYIMLNFTARRTFVNTYTHTLAQRLMRMYTHSRWFNAKAMPNQVNERKQSHLREQDRYMCRRPGQHDAHTDIYYANILCVCVCSNSSSSTH